MTIADVKRILNAEILCGDDLLEKEVHNACGSDMMSDVLAFVKDQSVLMTGLVNLQVIRTAEMLDLSCIVFVRGKEPAAEIIEMAEELEIAVLSTEYTMYASCGILYSKGLHASARKD